MKTPAELLRETRRTARKTGKLPSCVCGDAVALEFDEAVAHGRRWEAGEGEKVEEEAEFQVEAVYVCGVGLLQEGHELEEGFWDFS